LIGFLRQRLRPHAGQRLYFGWYIAGLAFLAHFMSVGTGFYAMNAFMQPLCQARGWSRTDLNLALMAGTLCGFMAQFVYGALLSRVQIRRLMLFGTLAAGTAFISMMQVQALWQYYALSTLLFLGNGAYGGIVANTAISNWFSKKRGQALGMATSGISLSGAVIPLAAMHIILNQGMQTAAMLIGGAIMGLGPLFYLVVRDWPEAYGLKPDGQGPGADPPLSDTPAGWTEPDCDWEPAVLFRQGAFWKLGFAFALLMSGAVGVMSQLKVRFTDVGFSDMQAMLLLTLTALIGTLGKYGWGWLGDRLAPFLVGAILAAVNGLGLVAALCGRNLLTLFLFVGVFGFGMGGIMSLYPAITASLFGRRAFARVYRFMSLFLIFQMSGYLIAGQSFDRLGSYDAAYGLFIAFDVIAAWLLFSIRPPCAKTGIANLPAK
jgi:sugar phosphate permease